MKETIALLLFLAGAVSVSGAQVPSARQRPGLPLELLSDTLAICRLPAEATFPA